MSSSGKPEGLRERKKRKTRDVIQQHALRLFDEQGYHETTIEQIAEAAEISPSTFYRYFPTKEDTVTYDALDPVMAEAFLRQPRDIPAMRAARAGFREAYENLSAETSRLEEVRTRLMFGVPELRARMIDQYTSTTRVVAQALAERSGRALDDPAVLAWSGATIGAGIAAFTQLAESGRAGLSIAELLDKMDALLGELEKGCDL